MKSFDIKAIPHYAWNRRWLLLSAAISAIGLALGISWFVRNLGLTPYGRGIMCCDSARYLWLSSTEIGKLLYHLSERTFGYPRSWPSLGDWVALIIQSSS